MPAPDQQRIVLTGSSGTLGQHIMKALCKEPGTTLLALVRDQPKSVDAQSDVLFERVDFDCPQRTTEIIAQFQPHWIIHSAATGLQRPFPTWSELVRFNVETSVHLCECAARVQSCRFMHISTGFAYREQRRPLTESDPLESYHPYGASKAAADLLVRSAAARLGVPLTVVRPFSFTGDFDRKGLFASILCAAAEGKDFALTAGVQVRDYCAVSDIAAGIRSAMSLKESDLEIFNLGSGNATALRELIQGIVEELQLQVQLKFGDRPYDRHEPMHLVANITKAQQELNWQPRERLAYAIWELAHRSFPSLHLKKPLRFL